MPKPLSPASSPPLPLGPFVCKSCGRHMALDRIEPDHRYTNLHVRMFVCECGETNSDYFTDRPPGSTGVS
jgi:hypothetical protein